MTTNTQLHQPIERATIGPAREGKRIFLTGATGSMGLAAAEALIASAHHVVGTTRSDHGAATLRNLGASSVEVDLLDKAVPYERRCARSTRSLTSPQASGIFGYASPDVANE